MRAGMRVRAVIALVGAASGLQQAVRAPLASPKLAGSPAAAPPTQRAPPAAAAPLPLGEETTTTTSASSTEQHDLSSVEPIVNPSSWSRPPPVLDLPGDSLEETPAQRAVVLGTAALAAGGALHAAAALSPLEVLCAVACAMLFADLLTGVFHWATDNYGSLDTPLVGPACAAFQGHHRAPWTITYRSTYNNVFKIGKIVAPLIALAAVLAPPGPALFLVVALFCQILAQEFHKFSHMPPSEHPALIRVLQENGLAISTAEHGRHHTSPFAGRYCIFNGALNPILDDTLFFRRLEAVVFRATGVEPNCWNEGDKGARIKAQALSL